MTSPRARRPRGRPGRRRVARWVRCGGPAGLVGELALSAAQGGPFPDDDTERVVIHDAASRLAHYRELGAGLAVSVTVRGADLVVEGDGLDGYLARLEPDVWDPARSRGDA